MTLAYTPAYPIPGETVTLSATGTTGSRADFELTAAPSRSALETGRLLDADGNPTVEFVPDYPGAYDVKVYDYRESGYAPARYPGDPIAQPRIKLLANQTGTVHVCASVTLPIVTTRGHGSVLTLRIANGTVRAASLGDHLTELSRIVAAQSAVTSALTACEGVTVATVGSNLVTGVSDLRAKYEAHRAIGGAGLVHVNADTTNVVQRYQSNTIEYSILLLNELYSRILAHTETGASAATRYHTNDDAVNVPLVGTASTVGQATVLFADLAYRVYERHRVQVNSPTPAVHLTADNANLLAGDPPKLTLLIVAYLDAVALLDPTAPTGESEGANDAAHRYGFTIEP